MGTTLRIGFCGAGSSVARAAGVDAIVFGCDRHGADVELVDVTMQLVALYEPNERTLGFVRDAQVARPRSSNAINSGSP